MKWAKSGLNRASQRPLGRCRNACRNLFSDREIRHLPARPVVFPAMLEIAIHNPRQHRQFHHADGMLTLSQSRSQSPLWNAVDQPPAASLARIDIQLENGGVSLAFSGCEVESNCCGGCKIEPHCHLQLPAQFAVGDTRFEIVANRQSADVTERPLQRLHSNICEPRQRRSNGSGPSTTTLSRWFAALGKLNHWATSLQELYVQAAECAVEAIGLDGAMVCRFRDGQWEIAASHLPHPDLGIHVDPSILQEAADVAGHTVSRHIREQRSKRRARPTN